MDRVINVIVCKFFDTIASTLVSDSSRDKNSSDFCGLPYMSNTRMLVSPKSTKLQDDKSPSKESDAGGIKQKKSAPMGLLAEFLTALMGKDYRAALGYCKNILRFEPDNDTAKDFYPLLLEKLRVQLEEEEGQSSSGHGTSDNSESPIESSSASESESPSNNDSDNGGQVELKSEAATETSTSSMFSSDDDGVSV